MPSLKAPKLLKFTTSELCNWNPKQTNGMLQATRQEHISRISTQILSTVAKSVAPEIADLVYVQDYNDWQPGDSC